MKRTLALPRTAVLALLTVLAPACGGGSDRSDTNDFLLFLFLALISPKEMPASPTVQITAPTSGPEVAATEDVVEVAGEAEDPSGITTVTWTNVTTGWTGGAEGTTSWKALIPLAVGENLIEVTATNGLGVRGTDSILIAR